jgi:hypothetical protein
MTPDNCCGLQQLNPPDQKSGGFLLLAWFCTKPIMRRPKPLHPTTADMRRELDIRVLAKALRRPPQQFPFQHIEVTARDHIRLFPLPVPKGPKIGPKETAASPQTVRQSGAKSAPEWRTESPQIIRVAWRPMTFGPKPFFVCPRCHARRVFLYFDTLQAYCRVCADLWYWCQRKHDRTRLLHWSHKLRVRLDDQIGKPGDQFPGRPHRQWKTRYHRTIAKLRTIEQQYMQIIDSDRRYCERDRDEYGRYLPSKRIASVTGADDLGETR